MDFLEFQNNLKMMRVLDDKIVYSLNSQVPTESFQKKTDVAAACQDLYNQIRKSHLERENFIKENILATAESVKKLKQIKEQKPDEYELVNSLKSEQRKLRLLQQELSIEEVLREKTNKTFADKCRTYYKPHRA